MLNRSLWFLALAAVVAVWAFGASMASAQQVVFVTETKVDGSINGGGPAGADAICQREAEAAGLLGTFWAWLSTTSQSAGMRFADSPGPFELPTGTTVANDLTDLLNGDIQVPINQLATGASISGNTVYTGDAPERRHDSLDL